MDIENELKKFNVSDAAIADLSEKYMPLVVNGINDSEGLKAIIAARKIIRGYRIDVDKRRKDLNADALEYQRRINAEAKRITAMLEPIEGHLMAEENKISDEIEQIKRKKEEAEQLG
jgi:seryl-tRNA synthetase